MKKYLIILLFALVNSAIQSQGISEALLFAQDNLNGTARFSAMSGAIGAVGGDFSSLNVNPAGSAIFSNNQATVTLSNYNIKNKSNYFGSKINQNSNTFDLNQAGAILVFNDIGSKSDWKKFTLAVNYENTNNFDNSIISIGTNPNQSATSYFASVANGINIPLNLLEVPNNYQTNEYYQELSLREQIAFLGYQGYLINPLQDDALNNIYNPNVQAGDFYHINDIESTGYNGKISFNVASEYKERFYFGLNINTHFTDYRKRTNFYEKNDNNLVLGFQDFDYARDLHTYGNGFSFQLGAIAKLTKSFRAGLSYESPTWYTLTDELLQSVLSSGFKAKGVEANPNTDVLIVYEAYKLRTPGKFTGSLSYVFGKKGLLSIDYSIKDYGNTRFKPNDSFFSPTNQEIKNDLTISGELRIGGEYRIKQWSLRGGFRNEQSPYKNKKTIGDLTGFSGGFGYNFGDTKLDLAYSHSQRKRQQSFFNQGFNDAAQINSENNNFTMTLLFEL